MTPTVLDLHSVVTNYLRCRVNSEMRNAVYGISTSVTFFRSMYSKVQINVSTAFLLTVLAGPAMVIAQSSSPFGIESGKKHRIVLVGNTLMAHESKDAFLELALTARWPNDDITFRNLGWPGDDVFGLARSQFGSGLNTRSWEPPQERDEDFGYETLLGQVQDAEPTVILVGYGSNAAFDWGPQGLAQFSKGYMRLLNALQESDAKLILLTPPRHESSAVNPNVGARNEQLAKIAELIRQAADNGKHQVIDLFETLRAADPNEPITENGISLNSPGYAMFASLIVQSLEADVDWRLELDMGGTVRETVGTSLGKLEVTEDRLRWELIDDTLPPAVGNAGRVLKVTGLPQGKGYRLKIDGKEVALASSEGWQEGVVVAAGPEFAQSEALRQRIIEKNGLYFQKLRPLNEAYIFLFRRYEMGHLSYEADDLDRLTIEQDEQIAYLKVPRPHRYELERADPWRPPREYPDHEVPQYIPNPDIDEELASFTVPDGFEINLFASDPEIMNPINANWDTRGRLWVSTSSTYPHIKPGLIPNDRIVILEDTDRDGQADKSTVFADGLTIPQSVMPIPGGAYVCSSTELLHLVDHDGDDHADERRVIYAGFGNADVHHMIHGLRWSPWGELYFQQSIYINSYLETAWGPRRLNGSGVWRFRPETERLEIYSRGMVNPWGLVFDLWGQSYATDGAGGDGIHYLYPGSAFRTAVGADRILSGLNPGKPKATGAEFISGRHFPESYRGDFILNDFRANRVVRYNVEESRSGYASREVETLVHSSYRSFRPVDLKMGPDGALYIVDWYNPIIDHGEVDFYHPLRDKSHGRIWRLTAVDRPLVDPPQIHGAAIPELFDALNAPETWTIEQARRELAGRAKNEALSELGSWLSEFNEMDPDYECHLLEGLWLHGSFQSPNEKLLDQLLHGKDHRARAAAVRFASLFHSGDGQILTRLALAARDEHAQVRLEAVNALRQFNSLEAANAAMEALDFPLDEELDYALWLTARTLQAYWLPELTRISQLPSASDIFQSSTALRNVGADSVFDGKTDRLTFALSASNDPRAIQPLISMARAGRLSGKGRNKALSMIAEFGNEQELAFLVETATREKDPFLLQALAKIQNRAVPANAADIVALIADGKSELRLAALRLSAKWGIKAGAKDALQLAGDRSTAFNERFEAAKTLLALGKINAVGNLTTSSYPTEVRVSAVAALVGSDLAHATRSGANLLAEIADEEQAALLFKAFTEFTGGPAALTDALKGKRIDGSIAATGILVAQSSGRDLSNLVGQLRESGSLSAMAMEGSTAERRDLISASLSQGDPVRGRKIYARAELGCVSCHAIAGDGGKVGPDLGSIGAFMTPEGILESLLKPNAAIKQGFETVLITLKNDEIVSGTLQRRTNNAALVRDALGTVRSVQLSEIKELTTTPISLMPPGLTAGLDSEELRDLLRFLIELGNS